MKITVAIIIHLTLVFLIVQEGNTGEIPREPLDRMWEEHMLTGTAFEYSSGRITQDVPTKSFISERSRGSPVAPMLEISVHDTRGTALFGLLRGGGWSLMGGLIGKVDTKVSTLELYAKSVWKYYPGFLGNYFRPKEEEIYEFFLLRRQQGSSQPTVIKKWLIKPEEIRWYVPGREHEVNIPEHIKQQSETSDVRGFIRYLPKSQETEVKITGLTHHFEERIKVTLR